MKILMVLVVAVSLHAATVVRMACGGPGGTDAASNVWTADTKIGGGTAWTAANQPVLSTQPIPYQSLCYSSGLVGFSRSFTVAPGNYVVTLKFLEPNKTAIGQRIFGASINGVPAVAGLDLFATAPGALKAYDATVQVSAPAGIVQIVLQPAVGNAVLSAVQIDSSAVVPGAWIPPTCTFASSPASPVIGQTCIFTDSHRFRSCTQGNAAEGMGQETCRWTGDAWMSISSPSEIPMFPFSGYSARATECTGGVVKFSQANPATGSVELPLFAADGTYRWDQIIIAETETFLPAGIGLAAAMGRPGGTDSEMSGVWVPLGVSSADSKAWTARPNPPQLSGPYSVVLAFHVADGRLLQELTAGSVSWEACGYRSGPMIAPAASHMASLDSCSGSGPGYDCAGIWRANIITSDGKSMPLIGTSMVAPNSNAIHWTTVK